MNEPSVLDYLKEQINSIWNSLKKREWPKKAISEITAHEDDFIPLSRSIVDETREIQSDIDFSGNDESKMEIPKASVRIPWKIILAVFFAIFAQIQFEPPDRNILAGISLYVISGFLVGASLLTREWLFPESLKEEPSAFPLTIKRIPLYISLPFLLLAFLTFSGNRFTTTNLSLWVIGLAALIWSLWIPDSQTCSFFSRLKGYINHGITLKNLLFTILVILSIILIIWFRFYRLAEVPGEMFSDHAEKLLDVGDILNGQFSIFFPRNTGREAIQMYLTAAIAVIFQTGLSFISLKLGTAFLGFLTLPYIYLLGKELKDKWVGLFSMLLVGMAYWPNVISRIGLRFPLYPLFAAPVLFYIIRGLRKQRRNDFVLAGIFLGLSVHGYSPSRFLPFVVLAAFVLFLLHSIANGKRKEALWGLAIVAFVSFMIFLPLLRYILEDPQGFSSRALSRLSDLERPLPGPVLLIFFSNLWKAFIMIFYDNGSIWVHSIPGRPALEVIGAALYFTGFCYILFRYIKRRKWEDLFLLVSVPLLMMPSILSIAFPDENPSLNRTGGALVPVFLIAAIGLDGLLTTIRYHWHSKVGKVVAVLMGITLIGFSAANNARLVFVEFDQEFMAGAWNTSDIGRVIRGFSDSIGNPDHAHVVPYPYWVDTRLVGINAGYPRRDFALWPEDFSSTQQVEGPQLFILNTQDSENLQLLQSIYPINTLFRHNDSLSGKDFWIFFIPAR